LLTHCFRQANELVQLNKRIQSGVFNSGFRPQS